MDLETLANGKYLSLTTFRRDGTPVATPVWLARQGDELVVFTAKAAGKAKRLRNSGRVLLAPCDMRGRVTGDAVEGTARLQDEAETAVTQDLIRRRYGVLGRFLSWREGRRSKDATASQQVGIAIRLNAPGPG
ncbi:MAG: PPOX class F420-dependent oxidoreductase [Chloroflexi bacterium]|nr:PPOX class F420-dependent oxidoreductase [Chloroflexota bacterium]